jgi:hypothetical protein
MPLHNVHERTIDAPEEVVGALLDRLGSDDDPLWPGNWMPIRLDRPLSVGADGGHGPIHYHVTAYEPGRRVRFTFHPDAGIDGYHELTVAPLGADRCVMRHELVGQTRGVMRILVPTVVRWLHDAVLEDLLDNAEREATGRVASPAKWSRWVRWLWRFEVPRPRPTSTDEARLTEGALERIDLTDAQEVVRLSAEPRDPDAWADAFFRRQAPPGVFYRVRNFLVRPLGIEPVADRSLFATCASRPDEVLVGGDAGHLDFRASVLVRESSVVLTSVVQVHNFRGRLYMAVVWRLHPFVVRRGMRRAARELNGTRPDHSVPAPAGEAA